MQARNGPNTKEWAVEHASPVVSKAARSEHRWHQAQLATSTPRNEHRGTARYKRRPLQLIRKLSEGLCFLLEDATGSPPQIGTLLNLAWKLRAQSLSMLRPALRWPRDRKNLKFAGRPVCSESPDVHVRRNAGRKRKKTLTVQGRLKFQERSHFGGPASL